MKKNSLITRSEAIGQLDDIKISWEDIKTPFWEKDKKIVHLPFIQENDLDDHNTMLYRGYIDHEVRHERHSSKISKSNEDFLIKNKGVCGIWNCLEDTRVELIPGKPGERNNIKKLRSYVALSIGDLENDNKYLRAMTANMYRSHDIDFNLTDEEEETFKEIKSLLDVSNRTKDVDECVEIAKKLYALVKNEEQEKQRENNDNKDNEGDSENSQDDQGEKQESGEEKSSDGDSESEPKNEKRDGDDEDESDKEEDKIEKIKCTTYVHENTDDIDEKIANECEAYNIENNISKEIENIYKSSYGEQKFSSFDLGDLYFDYSFSRDSEFTSYQDLIKKNIKNYNLSTTFSKYFKAQTSQYKKFGETKGKKIAKNRIATFSKNFNNAPFYVEENFEEIGAKVSILIDMSGSMSGDLIKAISLSAILADNLNTSKVDFEIIGFYNIKCVKVNKTSIWHSKFPHAETRFSSPYPKVYEIFHAFGDKFSLENYINIASQILCSWHKSTKKHWGPYNKNEILFLKENDDGAAVLVASKRLLKASSEKYNNYLFVLSDGEPKCARFDFQKGVLESDYLKECIKKIEDNTNIQIFGFGFCGARRISEFYKNHEYVEKLNNEFFAKLVITLKKVLKKSLRK